MVALRGVVQASKARDYEKPLHSPTPHLPVLCAVKACNKSKCTFCSLHRLTARRVQEGCGGPLSPVRPAEGARLPEPQWVEALRVPGAGPPRDPPPRELRLVSLVLVMLGPARVPPPHPRGGADSLVLNGRERCAGGGRGRGALDWRPAGAPSLACGRRRPAARSGVPCSCERRRRRRRHLPAEVSGAAPFSA